MSLEEARSGMGSITLWGNTPASDLIEVMKGLHVRFENGEIHILLMGQGDCRHVLKTLASVNKGESSYQIHVYIVESSLLLYARQLLLFYIALLPKEKVGSHEKVVKFMEIFGNSLIRPQTLRFLKNCAKELVKIVTDDNERERLAPTLHFDDLKHRERDTVVEILKSWGNSSMTKENVENMWDTRIRQALGPRYDARQDLYDWDYNMRMIEKSPEAKIIHAREYKTWRNTGLAFTKYESDYNQPNVTFVHGNVRTFKGDILIGPFIPYGIICQDKSLLEKMNQEFKNKSQDVTFHNLNEMFDNLEESGKSSNFHIHFLPVDTSSNLWKKSKFQKRFDLVLVSNFIGHQITKELVELVKPTGIVAVEQTRYVWYFRKENDEAYEKKVLELANSAGLVRQCHDEKYFISFEVNCKSNKEHEETLLGENSKEGSGEGDADKMPPEKSNGAEATEKIFD